MLKLSCSYDSVRFLLLKILPVTFCVIFQFLTIFNTNVVAGAASRYGSGSDQMMRFRAAPSPAPQHCHFDCRILILYTSDLRGAGCPCITAQKEDQDKLSIFMTSMRYLLKAESHTEHELDS
jgi:hypothetical protein